MSINTYIPVGAQVNSCLIGANVYRVLSDAAEFAGTPLEEFRDEIRQRPGYHYMRACTAMDKTELWMVPFRSTQDRLLILQDAMEEIQAKWLGTPGFHFPFDLVEEETEDPSIRCYEDPEENTRPQEQPRCTAYVIHPFSHSATRPFRGFLPNATCDRWAIAKNLFSRIAQLHGMGLTSCGIARSQLRINIQNWDVEFWPNHTVRLITSQGPQMYHQGFGTVPLKTAKTLQEQGQPLTGVQRDIFSCAVWAFYLIHYTHPFVGSSFAPLSRDEYLNHYFHFPAYIMDPESNNHLSNQLFDREVEMQWEKTVPQLKALFDGLFLAVSHPETQWKQDAPWWDMEKWLEALEADAQANNNESSRSTYKFNNYLYHLA